MKERSEGKGQLIEGVRYLLLLEIYTFAKILLNASANLLLIIKIIIIITTYTV